MARKGQFKKGGGRVGSGASRSRRRRSSGGATAIVVAAPRAPSRRRRSSAPVRHRRSRRRSRSGSGRVDILHLGLATAALGFLTGPKSPIQQIPTMARKIPGATTFGPAAIIGVSALAVDRFMKPNKWLKLLGTAGIVLAAAKIGEQGTDFKFVGDDDDYTADLDDVDDDDDVAGIDY